MLHYLPAEQVDLDPRKSDAAATGGAVEATEIAQSPDQAAGEGASPEDVEAKVPEQEENKSAEAPDAGAA